MTITFGNGKGGTGKTTMCLCVAMALRQAGKRVGISDRDPQGSMAIESVPRIATEQGPFLFDPSAGHKPEDFDYLLLDTRPDLASPETREAFAAADKIIVVSTPAPFDIMTSRRTATLVAELCPGKTAALLFNMVHANTILGRELDALAKATGLTSLFNNVRHRQCYQRATMLGWHELEKTKGQRATEEIMAVTLDILKL